LTAAQLENDGKWKNLARQELVSKTRCALGLTLISTTLLIRAITVLEPFPVTSGSAG